MNCQNSDSDGWREYDTLHFYIALYMNEKEFSEGCYSSIIKGDGVSAGRAGISGAPPPPPPPPPPRPQPPQKK
jgi:hypothetical protein